MENYKSNVIKFMAGQAISLFGSFLVLYAMIWYITLETKSGMMATISVLASFLPQVCISLFAGVWADKYNKKKLIMYADAMIAIATLILAILFFCGIRNIWLLFVIAAIRSLGSGIQMPAIGSFIPHIAPKDKLMKVNGIYSVLQSALMVVAPIISGALLAAVKFGNTYHLEYLFLIDVITAAIGIGLLYTVKYKKSECFEDPSKPVTEVEQIEEGSHNNHEKKQEENQQNQWKELKEGVLYLKDHKVIRRLLEYYAVLSFLFSPIAFLTTLMVTRTFGEEVWLLTAHEAVFGAGSVLGGVLVSIWGGFKNRLHTIMLACLICGLLSVAIGLSNVFLIYLIFMGITGIVMPFINTPTTVFLQENVESNLQGRVFSFLSIVTTTAMPLGMMLIGPLADVVKIQNILIVAGILIVLISSQMPFNKAFK